MKNQLIKLLHHLGLTATRFADEIGVQRSGISHILSERNQPSYDFIVKIHKRFPEISLDWLITGKGSMLRKDPGAASPSKDLFRDSTEVNSAPGNRQRDVLPESRLPENISSVMFTNVNNIEQVIILYKDGGFKPYSHPV